MYMWGENNETIHKQGYAKRDSAGDASSEVFPYEEKNRASTEAVLRTQRQEETYIDNCFIYILVAKKQEKAEGWLNAAPK